MLPVKTSARLMVSDVDAMLGVCEAGAGIGQVLQLDTRELIESGILIKLFPD